MRRFLRNAKTWTLRKWFILRDPSEKPNLLLLLLPFYGMFTVTLLIWSVLVSNLLVPIVLVAILVVGLLRWFVGAFRRFRVMSKVSRIAGAPVWK
jgi:hypothetical protein